MATTTPLTDAINALTTYSNSVTGASDTNLSDAVHTLAQGYGQGGQAGGQADDFLAALCENSADLQNYTELPVNLTQVPDYGFYQKTNLALTSLPSGITTIGKYGFYLCSNLVLTSLPSGVTAIGNYAFSNCSSLALTSLPSGITTIGNYAFYQCFNLALTSLPSSITTIGDHAFYNCGNLVITAIPEGITTIASDSFSYCRGLTELTIPSSVTRIEKNAFYSNNHMTAYHMLSTTPPTLSNTNAFTNIPSNCKIYVPAGALSAYQSATNWSTYASHM